MCFLLCFLCTRVAWGRLCRDLFGGFSGVGLQGFGPR